MAIAGNNVTTYDAAFSDLIEYVPDLMWPQSVWTFGQMRTDTQLRAALQAYTLPIRRATWQIDGTGCRPAAVQAVSDALGLTVKGTDAPPSRSRVRWAQFLRMALISLDFGHMGFEKEYDTSDGNTAKLTRLHERMPTTLAVIELDEQDDLLGVRQYRRASLPNTLITRDRLVWFAHEREGGAWQGRSILRPSYGPWLLKRELWKVNATSLRRNGMGVPVVQAPPGATQQQVTEAQRLASAHRVGDQSGVGLPAGFTMALQGITGSVPDPLAFIEYLDQQMTRSMLAGVVDLGATAHGSRALGDTFVDLLMLALQAEADEIAETVTEDVCRDIVELNFGPDEPIPVVRCSDVGQQHEVTAATLQALVAAGCLSADPQLEAYVRATWRLPAKDPNAPAPVVVPTAPLVPVVAGRTRFLTAAAPAWPFSRPPTTIEAAAKTDFVAVQDDWASALEQLVKKWSRKIAPKAQEQLLQQVRDAVAAGDVAALGALTVSVPGADTLVADAALALAADSVDQQTQEATDQGVDLTADPTVDESRLTSYAGVMAALLLGGLSASVARAAMQAWTPGATADDVVASVESHLGDLTDRALQDNLGSALSAAQAAGRTAVLEVAPPARYYASEVMDSSTCNACAAEDGHEFASVEEADAAYGSGGFTGCEGGLRCRGIVITVWGDGT